MEEKVTPNPGDVGFLGADGVMFYSYGITDTSTSSVQALRQAQYKPGQAAFGTVSHFFCFLLAGAFLSLLMYTDIRLDARHILHGFLGRGKRVRRTRFPPNVP